MKTYNRALDFMALAMDNFSKGRTKTAAKLFVQAASQTDASAAIAIIEASNAQAYTAKVKTVAKKVANPEKKQMASLIGDVDEDEFPDQEAEAEAEPEGEPEVVEDEAVENEDDAMSFATALAAAKKVKK